MENSRRSFGLHKTLFILKHNSSNATIHVLKRAHNIETGDRANRNVQFIVKGQLSSFCHTWRRCICLKTAISNNQIFIQLHIFQCPSPHITCLPKVRKVFRDKVLYQFQYHAGSSTFVFLHQPRSENPFHLALVVIYRNDLKAASTMHASRIFPSGSVPFFETYTEKFKSLLHSQSVLHFKIYYHHFAFHTSVGETESHCIIQQQFSFQASPWKKHDYHCMFDCQLHHWHFYSAKWLGIISLMSMFSNHFLYISNIIVMEPFKILYTDSIALVEHKSGPSRTLRTSG